MDPWKSNYKSHSGNVGLGMAIAYYTSKCIPVMIPLNDTQKYDLVIDVDGQLQKVSVKTTQYKKNKNYEVLLKNCGVHQVSLNLDFLIINPVIFFLF